MICYMQWTFYLISLEPPCLNSCSDLFQTNTKGNWVYSFISKLFISRSVLGYLIELNNDDLLYAMDILLDFSGTSELIFDFPDEDWNTVILFQSCLFPDRSLADGKSPEHLCRKHTTPYCISHSQSCCHTAYI